MIDDEEGRKQSDLLLKMCQIAHERLQADIHFAMAIMDSQGHFATACSPGLTNEMVSEMFDTIEEHGRVTVHHVVKRN